MEPSEQLALKANNREEWLTRGGSAILSKLILPKVTASNITEAKGWVVTCGWPSVKAMARSNRRVGECWTPESCGDGSTYQIFISPVLDVPVEEDGYGVLPCLAHELVHAVVGTAAGHKGRFKEVARAIGLEGKLTATFAGEELAYYLGILADDLGAYPHSKLDARHRPTKKQTTRMIKAICANCGYTIRVARSWIEVGLPTCHCGEVFKA